MQIVIDIDDETLQDLCDSRYVSPHIKDVFRSATLLPKGHGRLIDADSLYVQYEYADYDFDKTMEYAPTIIEADRSEKT